MTIAIVLVDKTNQQSALLVAVAAALTKQIHNHVSLPPPHGWGVTGHVRVATPSAPPKADEWQLALLPEPDLPDAYGYHDRTAAGLPLMKIFPFLDSSEPWSITASHEIVETLVDPELSRCSQAPDGKIWATEVCDAVERDTYMIDGIALSNFVLPSYFEPPDLVGAKFDHLGLIKSPLEIRPGGYGQYWTGTRWHMIQTAQKSTARKVLKDLGIGRGARRQAKKSPYAYAATVIRVIDGDTFVASLRATFEQEVDLGFHIIDRISLSKVTEQRIRLAGINAPELATFEGGRSKVALEKLLAGGALTVRTYLQDQWGRWLAEVWSGASNINQDMIAGGFATVWKGRTP